MSRSRLLWAVERSQRFEIKQGSRSRLRGAHTAAPGAGLPLRPQIAFAGLAWLWSGRRFFARAR